MMTHTSNNTLIKSAAGSLVLILILLTLLTVAGSAQAVPTTPWPLLEAGLAQKSSGQRLSVIRVLGLIPDDPRAVELAEKALQDPNSSVRAAAATALGQMHATSATASLKQALGDKNLAVVLAAAHALRLLNDPACFEVYYAILSGERKDDSGMVSQELKILRDPKQVAELGFNEGIGFVPFADIPWEAYQTIIKDRKSGAAARAALISALGPDPDVRANAVLIRATQSKNWVLRVAALEAIAKRGDATVLPEIEPRLSDCKREVRYTAAATIIHLDDVAKAKATKLAQMAPPATTDQAQATDAVLQTAK